MNALEQIRTRFGFDLPPGYQSLSAAGRLSPGGAHELLLSDLEWLRPQGIADFRFLDAEIEGLIPFARTARADLYAWRPAWTTTAGIPVVFCRRDVNQAMGYAPNFEGFVLRRVLEELSGTWLDEALDEAELLEVFLRYPQQLVDVLPEAWLQVVENALQKPLLRHPDGSLAILSPDECRRLIQTHLDFEHLDEIFEHYRRVGA